jgi:hypothetical protein
MTWLGGHHRANRLRICLLGHRWKVVEVDARAVQTKEHCPGCGRVRYRTQHADDTANQQYGWAVQQFKNDRDKLLRQIALERSKGRSADQDLIEIYTSRLNALRSPKR